MFRIAGPVLSVVLLMLVGCARHAAREDESPRNENAMLESRNSTLSDFNFGEDDIPEVLIAAVNDTYADPGARDCMALAAEIRALDKALGPDLDVLKASSMNEDVVAQALVGAVRGLIPYRSVLRMLTGANRRERRIAAAVAAGSIRRGYLKGLGEARHCPVPAAPTRDVD